MRKGLILLLGGVCIVSSFVVMPRHASKSLKSLDLDELEALERELERNPQRMNRLGRECKRYRWTQDGSSIYLTVPLPKVVPEKEVSLVITPKDFALQVIFAKLGEFRGISGQFTGDIAPEASRWHITNDDGPALQATLRKSRDNEFWSSFLIDEIPAPTVQFAGTCPEMNHARFRQHIDLIHLEFDIPKQIQSADISLRVTVDSWRLYIRSLHDDQPLTGRFYGRILPDDTTWLIDASDLDPDSNTLFIAFHKQLLPTKEDDDDSNWWPRLSLPSS